MHKLEFVLENKKRKILKDFDFCWFVRLFWFYGISTYVGYLMPNSF